MARKLNEGNENYFLLAFIDVTVIQQIILFFLNSPFAWVGEPINMNPWGVHLHLESLGLTINEWLSCLSQKDFQILQSIILCVCLMYLSVCCFPQRNLKLFIQIDALSKNERKWSEIKWSEKLKKKNVGKEMWWTARHTYPVAQLTCQ